MVQIIIKNKIKSINLKATASAFVVKTLVMENTCYWRKLIAWVLISASLDSQLPLQIQDVCSCPWNPFHVFVSSWFRSDLNFWPNILGSHYSWPSQKVFWSFKFISFRKQNQAIFPGLIKHEHKQAFWKGFMKEWNDTMLTSALWRKFPLSSCQVLLHHDEGQGLFFSIKSSVHKPHTDVAVSVFLTFSFSLFCRSLQRPCARAPQMGPSSKAASWLFSHE